MSGEDEARTGHVGAPCEIETQMPKCRASEAKLGGERGYQIIVNSRFEGLIIRLPRLQF